MTDSGRPWALGTQLALGLYLQAIEWIPMTPWNDLSHGNGQERIDLAAAALSTLLIVGTWRRRTWVVALGVVGHAAWLWLQLNFWWRPYLLGATAREAAFHARWFGRTWAFLPSTVGHPAPDAAHVVLHALLLLAIAANIVYAVHLRHACSPGHREHL